MTKNYPAHAPSHRKFQRTTALLLAEKNRCLFLHEECISATAKAGRHSFLGGTEAGHHLKLHARFMRKAMWIGTE